MSATDEDDLFTGRITPGFVNLAVGAPGPETLKKSAELFESAAKHRLAKVSAGDVSLFQYGLPCGNREYLRLIANFLSDEYGDQVQFKRLFTKPGGLDSPKQSRSRISRLSRCHF
jgi:alanine-alpha-ketoisovalerate/valine-pyruvate aminotransferase